LGRELEAAGVDFTADVVGFGLTAEEGRQVACLAENTGGKYIQASDEAALKEALVQTVAAQPELEPAPVVEPEPVAVEYNLVPKAVLNGGGEAPARIDVLFEGCKDDAQGVEGSSATTGYYPAKMNLEPGNYILVATSGGARAEQNISLTVDRTAE